MAPPGLDRQRSSTASAWAWLKRRRWRSGIAVAALALGASYPFVGGAIAARIAADKLQVRLGVPARIAQARAGLLGISFRDIQIGAVGGAPLVRVERLHVPFTALLFRRGVIDVDGVTLDLRRGGSDDNVTAVIAALRNRARSGATVPPAQTPKWPGFSLRNARVTAHDANSGLTVEVRRLGCLFLPNQRLDVQAENIDGVLALGSTGKGTPVWRRGDHDRRAPGWGAPTRVSDAGGDGGFATPLPNLTLTGIHGKIHPADGPQGQDSTHGKQLIVDLDGSYGGARETLWTARGGLDPGAHEGQVSLRAERFSLAEIADVLPKTVLSPADTHVDAAFDVSWAEGAVRFGGDMQVNGLSVEHAGLASEPVGGNESGAHLAGTAFPATRRVAIDRLEGRIDELRGKLSGFVELAPGTFTFADGSKLGFLPRMELTLEVPKLSCAKALASLPPTLVPRLQGFVMQGMFGAEITTRIDYANLDGAGAEGQDRHRRLQGAKAVAGREGSGFG